MEETHFAVNIFILLLLVASMVAMVTKWIRVPYTLALVMVGLAISPMHFLPVVHISPELILLIFLPALLFEAAWNLHLDHLRENLLPILTMAVFGVVLSVGIIGAFLHFAAGLSWSSSLLFGAIISATDPVSVLALFKHFGLPPRLSTLVEGESLINDGTSVVVFKIILGMVAGVAASGDNLVVESLREFVVVFLGGLALGAVIGLLVSTLTAYFDDHLLEITLTTIVAYGSFLLAESLHVSPVIAVLVAGLVTGNLGRERGMSPKTQVAVSSFWEYAAFVVNSLVFLLIGLEINMQTLFDNSLQIAWGVAAMLVARMAAVYGLIPIANLISDPIPLRWQHVLFWGGLRGSLSIALVLSLPQSIEGRSQLVAMIFGTVIFSLLFQGLTISPLLRLLRFTGKEERPAEWERVQARLVLEAVSREELGEMRQEGLIGEALFEALRERSQEESRQLREQISSLSDDRGFVNQQLNRARRRLNSRRKSRLRTMLREGLISEAIYSDLDEELDRQDLETEEALHSPADSVVIAGAGSEDRQETI